MELRQDATKKEHPWCPESPCWVLQPLGAITHPLRTFPPMLLVALLLCGATLIAPKWPILFWFGEWP